MAYDATLLAAIDAAIASLVAGTREVMITHNGKTVQYGQTNLDDLKSLRGIVSSEIAVAAATKPSFVLTSTSKGL